jgi:hypothetical protein
MKEINTKKVIPSNGLYREDYTGVEFYFQLEPEWIPEEADTVEINNKMFNIERSKFFSSLSLTRYSLLVPKK